MERKNINRGFKKLRVWPPARGGLRPRGQDAVSLYILACKVFGRFPFELKKVAANSSLKEYLKHLNIALGSCGKFHSCYVISRKAEQITGEDFEEVDQLHYKVENGLRKLVESLQKKQNACALNSA